MTTLPVLMQAYSLIAPASQQFPARHTQEGQHVLCLMRDAIAQATGMGEEEVQNLFSQEGPVALPLPDEHDRFAAWWAAVKDAKSVDAELLAWDAWRAARKLA